MPKKLRYYLSKTSVRIGAVFVVLCVGVSVLLGTTFGGSSIMWLVRHMVIPALGIKLDYQTQSLVPSKSLQLRGLHFKWEAQGSQVIDMSMDSLKFAYQIQLFPLRLVIDELEMGDPTVSVNLKIGPSPEKPKAALDFKALLKTLENLDSSVEIRRVNIKGLKGDVHVLLPKQEVDLSFSDFNLTSDFSIKKAFANLNFEMDFGKVQGLKVRITQKTGDEESVGFTTEARGGLRLSVALQKQNAWDFIVRSGATEVHLLKPRIAIKNSVSEKLVVTDQISLTFGSKLKISPERFCDSSEGQDFRVSTVIEASPIQFSESLSKQKIQATAHKWNLALEHATGGNLLKGTFGVTGLRLQSHGVEQVIPVDTGMAFSLANGCGSGTLSQTLSLINESVLSSTFTILRSPDSAKIEGSGKFSIPPKIAKTFQENLWKQVGLWSGDWTLHASNMDQHWNADLKAKLAQNFGLGKSAQAVTLGPVDLNLVLKNDNALSGDLNFAKIAVPKLADAFSASTSFSLESEFLGGDPKAKGNFQFAINGEIAARANFAYQSPKWNIDTIIESHPLLSRFLKPADIQKIGTWNVGLKANGELAGGVHLGADILRTVPEDPKIVDFRGPLHANIDISDIKQPQNLKLEIQIPELGFADAIVWGSHAINVVVRQTGATAPMAIEATIGKNNLEFLVKDKKPIRLTGIEGNLKVILPPGKIPLVDVLSLQLGDGAVRFDAKSRQDESGRNSISGTVALAFPESWPELPFGKIVGSGVLPWRLSQQPGDIITFDGKLTLDKFSVTGGPARIIGLSGDIPIAEVLRLKKGVVTFANMRRINPFEFVEFENFQPLTKTFSPLTIERIEFKEKTYGPLKAYISLDQNFFETRGLALEIPGGFIVGDLILDMNPANRTVGFLTRASGVRLKSIVPKDFSRGVAWSDDPMSGQAGMVVSLNKKEMSGRFDLTQIGSSQLISMINWVDPLYESDKLSACRTGLSIAYPKVVLGQMQNGFLDLSMALGGFAPKSYDVHSIPIAALVVSSFDRFGLK